MAWIRAGLVSLSLLLIGWHTPETRKADISGMPAFCCDRRDCVETDVRFLGWKGNFGWVFAEGQPWKVIGRGKGDDGIYVSPNDKTYICIRDPKKGEATCAMIRPKALW